MQGAGNNDHELVARALRGSQGAFRTIIEANHSVAVAAIRTVLGDSDEVEDVLQNTFIKVYRGLAGFRGGARLSTWIYRIARNEAINALSRRRPDHARVDDLELEARGNDSPEDGLAKRQLRERLEHALSRLDEEQHVALELRYLGECSYSEIAEIMDIPMGTVKTHIHRGKKALRRLLRDLRTPRAGGGDDR